MLTRRQFVRGAAATLALAGCTPRRIREKAPAARPQRAYVCGVAIDTSGSFQDKLLGGQQVAWKFLGSLVQKYKADTAGTDVRLVIAQICGARRAILWEGSLNSLRRRFSAASFRDLLMSKHHPGSAVHDSVAQLVREIRKYPGVADGKCGSAVVVLSDFDNNMGSPESVMLHELDEYRKVGGTFLAYFVADEIADRLRPEIVGLGYEMDKNFVMEKEFVDLPDLPSFQQ